jgi:exosortase/archaeosortase family protein
MATYVINVFRILIIVDMIAQLGTGSVFIAHAVVGRLFFFTGVVVVYWVLVTMPTVRVVFARLQPAPAEGGSHE